MSNGGPDEQENELMAEMRELRQEFQEYVEATTQYQTNRRVENIQVLIALSVVGGAISLYSGGFLDTSIWHNQIQSRYWVIILKVFISANAIFLLLKLITIPLLPVSSSGFISFLHEEVEPFLYFFAVLGVIFSLIVRALSSPVYTSLTTDQQGYLAIGSLVLPLLIAGGYAQVYRISSALQRERPILMEINHALDDLARTGAITAEMQARLMQNVILTMTPAPASLILLDGFEEVATSLLNVSEDTADSFIRVNNLLVKSLLYTTSPGISTLLAQFNQNLEDILTKKQTGEDQLSKQEQREIRNLLVNLRNKNAHGQLTAEDLMKISEYLEDYDERDSDNEE